MREEIDDTILYLAHLKETQELAKRPADYDIKIKRTKERLDRLFGLQNDLVELNCRDREAEHMSTFLRGLEQTDTQPIQPPTQDLELLSE